MQHFLQSLSGRFFCSNIIGKFDQQDAPVAERNADILRHSVISVGSFRKSEGGGHLPIQHKGRTRSLKTGLKNKALHGLIQRVACETGNAEIAVGLSRLLRFPPIGVYASGLLIGKQGFIVDYAVSQVTAFRFLVPGQKGGHTIAGLIVIDNLGPSAVLQQFNNLQRNTVFRRGDDTGGFGRTASYVERLAVIRLNIPGLRSGCGCGQKRQNQGQNKECPFCHIRFAPNRFG